MNRLGVSSLAAILLLVSNPTPLLQAQSAPSALIIHFAPGAVEPVPGSTTGTIDEFTFQTASLRSALVNAGVNTLAKIFPNFHREHVNSTNLIGEPIQLDDLSGFYLASLSSPPADAEARLRGTPEVLSVNEPQRCFLLSACPPDSSSMDTHYSKQWWLNNSGTAPCSPSYGWPPLVADADINAPEAWCITTGDSTVKVGIIDSGIWASHEDLNVNLANGVSFVPVQPIPPPPACYTSCPPPANCSVSATRPLSFCPATTRLLICLKTIFSTVREWRASLRRSEITARGSPALLGAPSLSRSEYSIAREWACNALVGALSTRFARAQSPLST